MSKLCFSTLSCPDWTWERIVSEAQRIGFSGLEVRGLEGEMYLPRVQPFLPENIDATRAHLAELGLTIVCLGSSAAFHVANVEPPVAEAKEYVDLARRLQAPYVRVFGNNVPASAERSEVARQIAAALQEVGEYAEGTGVQVLLETHGDFCRSEHLLEILQNVDTQAVGLVWDIHHTVRHGGESVEATYRMLGSYIHHVHLKDARLVDGRSVACLPGAGDVPLAEAVRVLRRGGYAGWYSLEWEKRWQPSIAEPEEVLPAFVRYMQAVWQAR